MKILFVSTIFVCWFQNAFSWPDGGPCLSKVMKSMYPSAPEHAGGQRDDDPPYRITVSKLCYYEGDRIGVTLEAQEGHRMKGFVMQARIAGSKQRTGEFARDDNGSWKFQCFKTKNGITHSHEDPKKKIPVVWFTWEKHQEEVQFIATVVENIKSFWYEKVTSVIIPHCRRGMGTTLTPYGENVLYQPAHRRPGDPPYDPNTIEPTRTTPGPTTRRSTTPFYTTTTEGPCEDQHPSCRAWTDFCVSGNWYVIGQCRRTCTDCVPEGFSPAPAIVKPIIVTPPPSPRGNCPDREPDCMHWHHMCRLRFEIRRKCPGTCNSCHLVNEPEPDPDTRRNCDDLDKNCPGWESMCQTFAHIRKKCPGTCRMC